MQKQLFAIAITGSILTGPSVLAQSVLPPGVTEKEFATIRAQCEKRWADDYAMRDYCERGQLEALQKLKARGPIDSKQ